jgi:hypothetical protein
MRKANGRLVTRTRSDRSLGALKIGTRRTFGVSFAVQHICRRRIDPCAVLLMVVGGDILGVGIVELADVVVDHQHFQIGLKRAGQANI